MSNVQETINDIAQSLQKIDVIDKKTLRDLVDDELPILNEYTGEEIQMIRKK